MIEALLAEGADESLGVRVRTRRTDRSADGLDADRGEHLVEAGGGLGVPVAEEESEAPAGILQVRGEIAGHRFDPWIVRVGGGSEDVHDPALHFDDDRHVVAPKEDRVDVEEVRGHNAPGLGGEELGPGWVSRRGAGGRPWRRSTFATLVFDTQTPSFFSSPTMRRYPHRGFSHPRRQINSTVSLARAGRPGRRCA